MARVVAKKEPAKPVRPKSMTKRQLATEISDIVGAGPEGSLFTVKEILLVLDALSETVENVVNEAGIVDIPGVCRIATKVRKAGNARNPATGETIKVAAKVTVRATPKPNLKRAVPSVQKARRVQGG
jgi:nucleoid DNA-binding protein